MRALRNGMNPMLPATPFGSRWASACAASPMSAKKPAAAAFSQFSPGETFATRAALNTAPLAQINTYLFVASSSIGKRRTPDAGLGPRHTLSKHKRQRCKKNIRKSGQQVASPPLEKKSHRTFVRCAPNSAQLLLLVPAQLRSAGVGGFLSPLVACVIECLQPNGSTHSKRPEHSPSPNSPSPRSSPSGTPGADPETPSRQPTPADGQTRRSPSRPHNSASSRSHRTTRSPHARPAQLPSLSNDHHRIPQTRQQ